MKKKDQRRVALAVVAGEQPASTGPRWSEPLCAALLTALLLSLVQTLVPRPMLLLERFIGGGGWVEVVVLAGYAGWIQSKMLDVRWSAQWRRRIWSLFSAAFFAQLILGLIGLERLLMTGSLHLPVPAMIIAGPLFRGAGWFMPTLFLTTVILVGPAWCSYLCYIGAWDSAFAHRMKRPKPLPKWRHPVRLGLLVAVPLLALGLRFAGVGGLVAAIAGLTFGLVGVFVMALWSRRTGVMAHCVTYCPIGLLACVLGRLSPFRLRIGSGCTDCGACTLVCRYDALLPEHIKARRPGLSCTLCGDCLRSCKGRDIQYAFAGLTPQRARSVFLVLVVSLHASFLGIARL